jgi:hypothetical protein
MKSPLARFGVAALVIIVLLLVFRTYRGNRAVSNSATDSQTSSEPLTKLPTGPEPPEARPASTQDPVSNIPTKDQPLSGEDFIERQKLDPLDMFRIKLHFYGKVVDESEQPVSAADIQFSWNTVDGSNNVTSKRLGTESDSDGIFSLENEHGNGVCVTVSKTGYRALDGNPRCFDYAQTYAANFHVPVAGQPVVFHLRKNGAGVALVTSQNGMRSSYKLAVPRDGSPVQFDPLQQKSGTGLLQFSQVKPEPSTWKQATAWSFQMTIPGGGFVECRDEPAIEAPATGYQPTVKLEFKKGTENWTDAIVKDYYIRFGNPPLFGRLRVETIIDSDSVSLTYAINPEATRTLEAK